MHVNKLSLNAKKTKYMLFTLRKNPKSSNDMFIDGENIEQVDHFRFLGVIINSKLSWSYHIRYKKRKCPRDLAFCVKLKEFWN